MISFSWDCTCSADVILQNVCVSNIASYESTSNPNPTILLPIYLAIKLMALHDKTAKPVATLACNDQCADTAPVQLLATAKNEQNPAMHSWVGRYNIRIISCSFTLKRLGGQFIHFFLPMPMQRLTTHTSTEVRANHKQTQPARHHTPTYHKTAGRWVCQCNGS